MMLTVIFYAFVVFTGIQVIYYLAFSSFIFNTVKNNKQSSEIPVSVLIFAKNEAENLQKIIPNIIQQKYTAFEIVLINDASKDNSLEVMQSFKLNHTNIKIIDVKNTEAFWGNKKYALTLGIKAATHEHLLFINPGSKTISKFWISKMSQHFNVDKTIVLGYNKYKQENSILNLLVRFETLLTAVKCFGYTKLGAPYRALGGNLAYKKSGFFKVKGFINHMNIKSGENDLFIQDAANNTNTTICTSEKSFTVSKAPSTFKEWSSQKTKQVSTANHYKLKHKLLLGLFNISKVLFYISGIILCFLYPLQMVLPIVITYYTIQYLVVGFASKKLKEPQIIYFIPFLEIGVLLFHFSIFISNLISKPNHWK